MKTAQLFAAAPEMLAALESVIYCVDKKLGMHVDLIRDVRRAIAKAKGRK